MKLPRELEQYTEPSQMQIKPSDSTKEADDFIRSNVKMDISVSALASSAHLVQRQFSRRITACFSVHSLQPMSQQSGLTMLVRVCVFEIRE